MRYFVGQRALLAAIALAAVAATGCGTATVASTAAGTADVTGADIAIDSQTTGDTQGSVDAVADLPSPADAVADVAPGADSDDAAAPLDNAEGPEASTDAGPAPDALADLASPDDVDGPDGSGPDSAGPDSAEPDSAEPDSAGPDSAGGADAGADTAADAACLVNPEICDGVDNDCDGETDESAAATKGLCDDGNACTDDACNGASGCSHLANTASCDDLNACSTGDACKNSACATTAKVCDDGDVCTVDSCDVATGGCSAGAPKVCDDANPCSDDSCDKTAGCMALANTAPCSDGDACTGVDGCKDKACAGGAALDCNDQNPCTDDSCDKVGGCKHANNTVACDDGQNCTTEACAAGACKATAKVCDDKDVCTTDNCDGATGGCVAAQVSGCKPCAIDTDCNDSDACTTDKCVSAKCQITKIAGCFGAADFVIDLVDLATPSIEYTTAVKWTLTAHNNGKKATGVAMKLWLSEDEAITAADFNLGGDTTATGPLGLGETTPSKVISYTTTATIGNMLGYLSPKHKFLCAQIVYAADPTPADNVKCVPIAVLMPQWQVTTIKPAKTPWFWNMPNEPYATSVTVKNAGNGTGAGYGQAKLTMYLSADAAWDANDFEVAKYKLGAPINLAPGLEQACALDTTLYTPKTNLKFLCARLTTDYVKELDMTDNVLCVPHDVQAVGEFNLVPVWLPNTSYNPPMYGPTFAGANRYGVAQTCAMFLQNFGDATMNNYSARCWLQSGAAGAVGAPKIWEAKGISTTAITPSGALTVKMAGGVFADLPDGAIKSGAASGGIPQPTTGYSMCVAFNEDGAVPEKNLNNNQTCANILITSVDLGWYDAAGPAATVTTIKAGAASKVGKTHIKNFGSANTSNNSANPLYVHLLLSADAVASADDVILFKSPTSAIIPPGQAAQIGNVGPGSTEISFTIPAGTVVGGYFLVLKIDATDVDLEANEANNKWSAAITVN